MDPRSPWSVSVSLRHRTDYTPATPSSPSTVRPLGRAEGYTPGNRHQGRCSWPRRGTVPHTPLVSAGFLPRRSRYRPPSLPMTSIFRQWDMGECCRWTNPRKDQSSLFRRRTARYRTYFAIEFLRHNSHYTRTTSTSSRTLHRLDNGVYYSP